VSTVVAGFVFCRWEVVERAVWAALVPPPDPLEGGQLDLAGGAPGATPLWEILCDQGVLVPIAPVVGEPTRMGNAGKQGVCACRSPRLGKSYRNLADVQRTFLSGGEPLSWSTTTRSSPVQAIRPVCPCCSIGYG